VIRVEGRDRVDLLFAGLFLTMGYIVNWGPQILEALFDRPCCPCLETGLTQAPTKMGIFGSFYNLRNANGNRRSSKKLQLHWVLFIGPDKILK
jgi:hypothetical protein